MTTWAATALRPAEALVPLEPGARAEVVVVGLGAAGLTAACVLAEAGVDVLAVDRTGPGAGASGRNGGLLLAGLAEPYDVVVDQLGRDRALAAYRLTLDALDRAVDAHPGVRRTGSLRLSRSAEEDAACARQLAAMRADGLPVEPYDGAQGRGLLFGVDASFQPLDRTRELAARAVAAGARLATGCVTGVSASGATTAAGRASAGRGVVVAVDGGLAELVPALAGRVRSARLQMVGTAPSYDVVLDHPAYVRFGLDYWQQLPDGRIALGGGRDRGGEAEWTTDAVPSAAVQQHLDGLLREEVGIAVEVEHRWVGIVGFTPDGLPVLAEPEPGLLVVGGYSGTGNLVGPLCATWAAERLLGRDTGLADLLA